MTILGMKANFLNAEQKKLKQNVIEGLMDGLFGKIHSNIGNLLDQESATDILISCIIMFTRECIVNFVLGSNINDSPKEREELVGHILGIIQNEIMGKLNKGNL